MFSRLGGGGVVVASERVEQEEGKRRKGDQAGKTGCWVNM